MKSTKSREDFVFFWRHIDSPVACFSQWYPSDFMIDGIRYNCAEQYMMAEKAGVFGDKAVWSEIMASSNPEVIKKLGRRVGNLWKGENRLGFILMEVRDILCSKQVEK